MKSPVIKRSIVINGQKTSVSLEDAFWSGLKEIAHGQQASLTNVVAEIDKARQGAICLQRSVCLYSTGYAHGGQAGIQ